ncbi:hypothetical protein ABZT03_05290 [Streptomyces sp. NPDC005574]
MRKPTSPGTILRRGTVSTSGSERTWSDRFTLDDLNGLGRRGPHLD